MSPMVSASWSLFPLSREPLLWQSSSVITM
jgi:hypothetical protein